MFTRIVLDNFLSFGHVEFDLSGAYGKPLNYAFVYGENGSGKTNLVRSIAFLQNITNAVAGNDGIDSLGAIHGKHAMAQADGQMHVRYEFILDGRRGWYDLAFTMTGDVCREELVYSTPKGNRGRYFLVEKTMDFPSVSLGKEIFRGELSKNLRKEMNRLWGKSTALAIINSEYSRNTSTYMDRWSFEGMGTVLKFVQSISTNIGPQGMPGHSPVPYLQNIDHRWIERIDAAVLDAYEEAVSSFFIRLCSDIRDIRYDRRVDGSSIEYRLMVTREIAGKERVIPFEDESSGIKKLLSLFPSLMSCALGSVTFIDELDSGIHDKMVRDLISQAMDAIGGQLVVTTHNTSLLETLDPRHVFVIRVDSEGYKEISSFNDIAKTQGNNNNRIRYGNGLFGGIPLIRDLDLKGIAEDLGRGADPA